MKGRSWEDVKADLLRLHPELDDPKLKARARAELDAYVTGYHLKEMRKSVRMTQKQVAKAMGVTQARISQIENGDVNVMIIGTLRAYAAAIGGQLNIAIAVGPHSITVEVPDESAVSKDVGPAAQADRGAA